jgi:hypothetical protein
MDLKRNCNMVFFLNCIKSPLCMNPHLFPNSTSRGKPGSYNDGITLDRNIGNATMSRYASYTGYTGMNTHARPNIS